MTQGQAWIHPCGHVAMREVTFHTFFNKRSFIFGIQIQAAKMKISNYFASRTPKNKFKWEEDTPSLASTPDWQNSNNDVPAPPPQKK